VRVGERLKVGGSGSMGADMNTDKVVNVIRRVVRVAEFYLICSKIGWIEGSDRAWLSYRKEFLHMFSCGFL